MLRKRFEMRRWVPMIAWAAITLSLASCSNDDADLILGEIIPTFPGDDVSLALSVQPLFTTSCATAGCHSAASAQSGLVLEEGKLFNPATGIVEVASQQSSLLRVESFSSDDSYLIHKLEGTQASVGGAGSSMPSGAVALSQEAIQVIRDWIDQGAQDN